jgi:hypothetical protein
MTEQRTKNEKKKKKAFVKHPQQLAAERDRIATTATTATIAAAARTRRMKLISIIERKEEFSLRTRNKIDELVERFLTGSISEIIPVILLVDFLLNTNRYGSSQMISLEVDSDDGGEEDKDSDTEQKEVETDKDETDEVETDEEVERFRNELLMRSIKEYDDTGNEVLIYTLISACISTRIYTLIKACILVVIKAYILIVINIGFIFIIIAIKNEE